MQEVQELDLEIDNGVEDWKRLNGRATVSGNKLQKKLDETVACRYCQGDVEIIETVSAKAGLGSTWIIRCQNESCSSYATNSSFTTAEKGMGFEINKASVLSVRTVGSSLHIDNKYHERLANSSFFVIKLGQVGKQVIKDNNLA